jgi:hypothetical protein
MARPSQFVVGTTVCRCHDIAYSVVTIEDGNLYRQAISTERCLKAEEVQIIAGVSRVDR